MTANKFAIVFVSLLLLSSSAQAANRESKERAAKRACLNGEPTKGVQILTDLYIDSNDPTYIYNQGRCFEQNSRYEEAIGRFREYVRKAVGGVNADPADIEGAQKHIADCQAVLAKRDGGAPQPAVVDVPKAAPAPQAQAPMPAAAPAPAIAVQQPPPPASHQGSGLRVAGVVTAAVGVAALAGGVALNLRANSMIGDLEKHYSANTYSSSKDYKTFSQVGYGVGAALFLGGTITYYLGWRAGATLVPTVASGSAGAVLTGAF
jgi:hypothetical protein